MNRLRFTLVHRYLPLLVCLLALASGNKAALAFPAAGSFESALSSQGFTGLLNIPNAELVKEGRLSLLYSNQIDDKFRSSTRHQDNYIFNVGLFSLLEIGGRLTEAPASTGGTGVRDLSANFKIKVPFIPEEPYFPRIALGMQDVGGGAKHLQTRYVVITEDIWRARLSLGYGAGPDRMKGFFAGGELKAFDWLYLLGEYDTRETNAGLRVITPYIYDIPVNLFATLKTSLDHRPGKIVAFSAGLQLPLGTSHYSPAPLQTSEAASNHGPLSGAEMQTPASPPQPVLVDHPSQLPPAYPPAAGNSAAHTDAAAPQALSAEKPASAGSPLLMTPSRGTLDTSHLLALHTRLISGGFRNVRVGWQGEGVVVIEYENSRYNHNELDALGVVWGMAAAGIGSQDPELRVIIRRKGIAVLQVSAPLSQIRTFMDTGKGSETLRNSLRITQEITPAESISFVDGEQSPARLRPSLVLMPQITTFVGTEVGVFDYLLSLRPELNMDTWKGGGINLRWDIPLAWSGNFDEGKPFRNSRHDTRLERAMFFQILKPLPTVSANIGAGKILPDLYGTLNELWWSPGDGTHRITLRQMYADLKGGIRESYLGSYRYYHAPLDTELEAVAGKFHDQDRGFIISMKRFFGDTAFGIYYKNSTLPGREHIQAGGVQISLPLTLRRDMPSSPLQLRGTEEWNYTQESEIVTAGHSNQVGRAFGNQLQPPFSLYRVLYNRDRLNEPYIKEHLPRLRDAYDRYGKD